MTILFLKLRRAAGSKLATAITHGAEAINKLIRSGEIDELRDVIELDDKSEEGEDYLLDDGEVDYSKVPDVKLPAPLASSKFAQDPRFFRTHTQGGQHQIDDLLNWNDNPRNERARSFHQPVFSHVVTESPQLQKASLVLPEPLGDGSEWRQHLNDRNRSSRKKVVEDAQDLHTWTENQNLKTTNSPSILAEVDEPDLGGSFQDEEYRSAEDLLLDPPNSKVDLHRQWNKDFDTTMKINIETGNNANRIGAYQRDHSSSSRCETMNKFRSVQTNYQNQSNSPHSHHRFPSKMLSQPGVDMKIQRCISQQESSTSSRPLRPQSRMPYQQNEFRSAPNGSFNTNVPLRQNCPFPSENPFTRYPRPPPNFRLTVPDMETDQYKGPNFRGNSSSVTPNDNYRLNIGGYPGFMGSTRGTSTNLPPDVKPRTNLNHHNQSRDADQSKRARNRNSYS